MQSVKSNTKIEDFIANLPKESLFMRRSRLSISSKIGDSKMMNSKNFTFCKENRDNAGPLTDVSNQTEKAGKPSSVASHIENEGDVISSGAGSQHSVIPKGIGLHMKSQRPTLNTISHRRSFAAPPKIQPVCLSSKKKTPNRPYSASKSPRWAPLSSRLKDPPNGIQLEKIRLKRQRDYNEQENKPPPTTAFKSPHIMTLAARRNMGVGIFSSTKKMQPSVKRHLADNLNATKVMKPKKDQECCRTLQFQESEDMNSEEMTKPLPQVDLNSSKMDGSMFHGPTRVTASSTTNASEIQSPAVFSDIKTKHQWKITKGETFIANSPTSLPVRIARRRSAIPVCKRDYSSIIKSATLADITEISTFNQTNNTETSILNKIKNTETSILNKSKHTEASILNKSKSTETSILNKSKSTEASMLNNSKRTETSILTKSTVLARRSHGNLTTGPIPEIRVLPSSSLSEIETSLDSCSQSPSLEKSLQGGGNPLASVGDGGESPPPPPNSPSAEKGSAKMMTTFVLPERTVVEPKPESFKDASCNTVLSASLFQGSYLGAEKLVEEALTQQERIQKEFQVLVQEFTRRSEALMMQYKATFDPIKELRKQFAEKLNVQATQRGDKLAGRAAVHFEDDFSKRVETAGESKQKIALNFLGTPLPRKMKNRLTRSFSHPPSPELMAALESPELTLPISREESFQSVQSDYSPFTNCVGDCERPSLAPMTPSTRLNVTVLKQSMNKQLQNLFE